MYTVFPVILAGGSGSRLWPLSRQAYPKQLLSLLDNNSLLQNTLQRLSHPVISIARPLVITSTDFRFMVAEQLREIHQEADIILESVGRNTAPAVAVAAIKALQKNPHAILLVLPADHAITNQSAWEKTVQASVELAANNFLVTLGIHPNSPVTGYGYIKPGNAIKDTAGFRVEAFVEKPDLAQAQIYVDKGYLWNSGIFIMSAATYLSELEKYAPRIKEFCELAVEKGHADLDFFRLQEQAMQACPSDSVDYAVMEKTIHAAVIPVEMGWSDIGSWSALHDISEKDIAGNTILGDVIQRDTKNSYLRSENRMLAVLGLQDCIVVETADVVLVAHKEFAQHVKELVGSLKLSGRCEIETGRKVFRPWGWYETLIESPGFKVKEIMVNPGAKLSSQMHHHRSEHWVVVSGDALVNHDDKEFLLKTGESTFISQQSRHRLSNTTNKPLHIIEVQCGDYLGEDDIVRFEDVFGRATVV